MLEIDARSGQDTGTGGVWPTYRTPTLDWLIQETGDQPFFDNLFFDMCNRLAADGMPLDRGSIHLRTLHPQFLGARILWHPDLKEPELKMFGREVLTHPDYLRSPIRMLQEGAGAIRQRLDRLGPEGGAFPIYNELRDEGFTDYVALPIQMTNGTRHSVSFATRICGGFSTEQLQKLYDILPLIVMTTEIRLNRRITKNLLNTYVGKHAGENILAGDITRGSGETIRAAIWNCDIRGFTSISEQWPRDDVILWLNEYFDTMVEPVERLGGEILKFVGDGMLAIFPLDMLDACNRAFRAAVEALEGMAALNARRVARGDDPLGHGIALHVGDVMYGNIGSASRLDFTVIGPAVNVSARMQGLCRDLGHELLVSGTFVNGCEAARGRLESLGEFPLRGVGSAVELLAYKPGSA